MFRRASQIWRTASPRGRGAKSACPAAVLAALLSQAPPALAAAAEGVSALVHENALWLLIGMLAVVLLLLAARFLEVSRSNQALLAEKRRAEAAAQALGEYEARNIQALEKAPLSIQVADAEGRRVFVNQAYADLAGYGSREELLNADRGAFIAPHDRARVVRYREDLMSGRPSPASYEMDAVRKDGSALHVRVFETNILWQGAPAVQRIFVDLTESKETGDALRASEERLRNAQRIVNIGDWQRNYRTNRSIWSEQTYRIFGIERSAEPSLELFMSLVHPDDRAALKDKVRRSLETGTPYAMDHRIIRPDGVERIIHERGEYGFDADGAPLTFSGTAQDVTELRAVERGLARSEARFRSVIEAGGAGILLSDAEGRCELVNPEFARLAGRTQPACQGVAIADFIAAADRAAFATALASLDVEANRRLETECRLARDDGDPVWASVNLTVTRDGDTGEARFIAIVRDITDRKRAEAELARKTEMLDLARAVAITANLAPSFEQAVTDCIERICGFTGWQIGHAYVRDTGDPRRLVPMGRPWLSDGARFAEFATLSAGVAYDEDSGFVGRVITGRRVHWQNEFPYAPESPGPRSRTASDMGLRLGVGAPVMVGDRIVAVLEFFATESGPRDDALCEVLLQLGTLLGRVYERENAARALRDREMQLSQIIDNVPYRIYVKDRDGRFLLVNRAVAAFFQRGRDEIVGRRLQDFYPDKEHLEGFASAEREVLERGRTIHTAEERVVAADGSVRFARTLKTPYTTRDGERAVLGISFDITEEKAHQEQLRRAQRMDALGQMTGGVAHDFNNLLTIILGNLQLLERRLTDETLRAMAVTAESAARRGAEVTRRLLAFARSQPLAPSTVELNDLVTAVAEIAPLSLGVGIAIERRLTDGLWPTMVDPAEMENALLNLLLNARDAMPQGGLISVETRNVSLPGGHAEGHNRIEPGDYVLIGVADMGAGMSEEVLSRAVEPFFTTKEVGKGSGLGLSMVYGFAQQSGGGVFIDSAVGQGTTVHLYLPRSVGGAESPEADTVPEPTRGALETVLLVEDDPDVRAFTATALSNLNYRILEARDAAAALRILDSGAKIDLLFTDVMLPGGMDGRVLAREAGNRLPQLPILFTSGNWEVTHPDDAENWLSGKAILQKPYTQGELGDMIRRAIQGNRKRGAIS